MAAHGLTAAKNLSRDCGIYRCIWRKRHETLRAAQNTRRDACLSRAKRLYFSLNAIIRAHKEQFGSIGGKSGWLP
jgi:hypothetical protein